jgi:hypothetical protein
VGCVGERFCLSVMCYGVRVFRGFQKNQMGAVWSGGSGITCVSRVRRFCQL